MLDTETKRKIDNCRDILVGKVPDPKGQVEQITIALIYKFMDDMDAQSIDMGGKPSFFTGEFEKYSWSSIFDPHISGFELLNRYGEALVKLEKNPKIPQLFRDIFKNAYLPYRDPETLRAFLKEIRNFSYDHSERLGDAFEYLLSVLSSQGEAGQFRTPRNIIDFIVEVVSPQKHEKILDPACGTAGFLISAYKHILRNNPKLSMVQKKRLMDNFVGYDISYDMVRLSLVNMYLHGFSQPHIFEYDTLTYEDRWDDTFDVIMANPPFMSPKGGIRPHSRFAIRAKRSEVLFVDYIAEHLNPSGRAGVIVPEGIIFQSQNAYKALRKMLVENYLWAVVSLPAGIFNPYAGVKTSILLMDKSLAKRIDKILFIKIENDGYDLGAQRRPIDKNDIPAALKFLNIYKSKAENYKSAACHSERSEESHFAHAVLKNEIAKSGDYNLSGDIYKVFEAHKQTKWPIVTLENIILEIKDGGTPSRKHPEYFGGGINWCVVKDIKPEIWKTKETLSELGLKNSSARLWPVDSIIISLGATIGQVGIAKTPTATKQGLSGIIVNKAKIIPKYLFYLLQYKTDFIKSLATGVTIKEVRPTRLKNNFKIPLPPLSVQKAMVSEIDGYQKIIDGARQVVENYKPTIKIDPDWPIVKLSEICSLQYGYTAKGKNKGNTRFIRITDIDENGTLRDSDQKFIDLTEEAKDCVLKKGDLLVARTGATYGKTMIFEEAGQAVFASFLIRLSFNPNEMNPRFYWAFAQSEDYWNQARSLMTGGGQPQFNANAIKKIKICLPPLETQKEIVAQIKAEQEIVNANKKLIEIFEQKIKDKIAEVWGEK